MNTTLYRILLGASCLWLGLLGGGFVVWSVQNQTPSCVVKFQQSLTQYTPGTLACMTPTTRLFVMMSSGATDDKSLPRVQGSASIVGHDNNEYTIRVDIKGSGRIYVLVFTDDKGLIESLGAVQGG